MHAFRGHKECCAIFTIFLRALILYALIILTMRFMGKRQIGQLQPFELVISILIAEVAATPMANMGIPLVYGVISIIALFAAHNILAFGAFKSQKLRGVISGKPTIIIDNGRILQEELAKLNFNLDELLEHLRVKNAPAISKIQYAILETNGQLSVILKSESRPLTPQDVALPSQPGLLPIALVIDGKVDEENLKAIARDCAWLQKHLRLAGFPRTEKIFVAAMDESGQLFIQGCAPDDRVVYHDTQEQKP